MYVFNLFESNDIQSVKLGIKIIESQNYQKEFENYFNISFGKYCDVYNNFITELVNSQNFHYKILSPQWIKTIYELNFFIDKLDGETISLIVCAAPETHKYFDLNKLSGTRIAEMVMANPTILNELDNSISAKRY